MCVVLTPGVLVGLASELDQSVGLGVPEDGTCIGLMELLRALRSELGVDGALREAAVGPRRPERKVEPLSGTLKKSLSIYKINDLFFVINIYSIYIENPLSIQQGL